MIIGANDFTFSYLRENPIPSRTITDHCTHVALFAALVVKLKHNDVLFAAVYTRVSEQVATQVLSSLRNGFATPPTPDRVHADLG
jgi:hypothetical protein